MRSKVKKHKVQNIARNMILCYWRNKTESGLFLEGWGFVGGFNNFKYELQKYITDNLPSPFSNQEISSY